jgi:hypothetical protein
MGVVIIVLIIAGMLLIVIGNIMEIAAAFRISPSWGWAYIFLPGAQLFFTIKYWSEIKKAFVVQLLGVALIAVSFVYGGKYLEGVDSSLEAATDGGGASFLQGLFAGEEEEPDPFYALPSTVGMTIDEARELLGPPKAFVVTDAGTTLYYDGRELEVVDGAVTRDDAVRRMKLTAETEE